MAQAHALCIQIWARDLRDQCEAAGVPFLFKQWGVGASSDGEESGHVYGACRETSGAYCVGNRNGSLL